jgi:hypothetical protein
MNELTDEQIDQCWGEYDSGYGRSRYDIARAIIAAHEAQRQAVQEPVTREGCNYVTTAGKACSKCGEIHHAPQP